MNINFITSDNTITKKGDVVPRKGDNVLFRLERFYVHEVVFNVNEVSYYADVYLTKKG